LIVPSEAVPGVPSEAVPELVTVLLTGIIAGALSTVLVFIFRPEPAVDPIP